MKKSEIMIGILVNYKKFANAEVARREIAEVFTDLFPGSDFEEWDQLVDQDLATLIRNQLTHGSPRLNIKYLIRDIDHILERV